MICKETLENFDCGVELLNEYLSQYALKNDLDNIGRTYLYVDENKILGFFTIANGSINHDELPTQYRKIPKYPVPVTLLARLGVDVRYQKKGLGRRLIQDVIKLSFEVSQNIASYAIVVDAKPASTSFYELMGFEKLNEELRYFYPMRKIEKYLLMYKN